MKNLLFILSLSFLMFSSCSSGDDTNNNISIDILVGTWQYSKIGVFDTGTIVSSDVVLQYPWDHDCLDQKDYLQLDDNGVAVDVYYNENCVENISTSSWTRTDDFIVFTNGTESIAREIIKLTNNELIIKFPPQGEDAPEFEVWGLIKL